MKKTGIVRALSMVLVNIALLFAAGCASVQEKPPAFMDTAAKNCLKEGEPCSTLNNECCPGYRCYIGLDPRCVRDPGEN
uniref:Lipoprotein n=1 Tax=Geobacter sp. (strain M21) TaxID=443144 RepID=C6E8L6_GEOSM